ncbi:hypothetical protein ACET3Z_005970 [Daucus carota]
MGILNTSELLLSEECSFLSRPLLDFEQGSQHDHRKIFTQEKDFDKFEENLLKLEVKLPRRGEIEVEQDNGGCRTPTSTEQKIPTMICPSAPRKARPVPSRKRRANSSCRILLDFSSEVESMFPEAVLADLGNKIKRVRTTR